MRFDSGTPPEWISTILDAVREGFHPEVSCGPLGYVWIVPKNSRQAWKVSVFPTPGEIYEIGPRDGKVVVPGFHMNLGPLFRHFEEIEQIDWMAPSEYTGELDGPGVAIRGRAFGQKLHLFLFEEPPQAFEPTVVFDQTTGVTRPKRKRDE